MNGRVKPDPELGSNLLSRECPYYSVCIHAFKVLQLAEEDAHGESCVEALPTLGAFPHTMQELSFASPNARERDPFATRHFEYTSGVDHGIGIRYALGELSRGSCLSLAPKMQQRQVSVTVEVVPRLFACQVCLPQ